MVAGQAIDKHFDNQNSKEEDFNIADGKKYSEVGKIILQRNMKTFHKLSIDFWNSSSILTLDQT